MRNVVCAENGVFNGMCCLIGCNTFLTMAKVCCAVEQNSYSLVPALLGNHLDILNLVSVLCGMLLDNLVRAFSCRKYIFPDSTLRGDTEQGDNNQIQIALVLYL